MNKSRVGQDSKHSALLYRWTYRIGERAWRDETKILIFGIPAGALRLRRLVDPAWIGAGVIFAGRDDTTDVAVGRNSWDGGQSQSYSGGESMHLQDVDGVVSS